MNEQKEEDGEEEKLSKKRSNCRQRMQILTTRDFFPSGQFFYFIFSERPFVWNWQIAVWGREEASTNHPAIGGRSEERERISSGGLRL